MTENKSWEWDQYIWNSPPSLPPSPTPKARQKNKKVQGETYQINS